jgi:hypothetical protein
MVLTVVFSNKPSPLNKKIIKFFQVNLASLNNASLVFEFEVAHPGENDSYVNRGIKNFPVLLNDNVSATGVEKIIQYLKMCVTKYNKKILVKTDDEKLDEFWKQTMGDVEIDDSGNIKPDVDDDDAYDAGENLQHRIQEAFEQRNSDTSEPVSSRKPNTPRKPRIPSKLDEISPANTLTKMKSTGKANRDDVLMAKFFENQEES